MYGKSVEDLSKFKMRNLGLKQTKHETNNGTNELTYNKEK